MLQCSCCNCEDGWYYISPNYHYRPFAQKRRKWCCSCGDLIEINALSVEFDRYRPHVSDVEERIFGDEVSLASWFMCEPCGEIYYNLSAIGYCIYLGDDMRKNLRDYWEITEFKTDNKAAHMTANSMPHVT